MTPQDPKIRFPLWQFLNQPLFSSDTKLELHPKRFAYRYRIQLLERCWTRQCGSKGHHRY
ncbi:MAG TPA: hypothetical protein V6C85_08535 [Allocoleopsis sp.]